MLGLIKKFIPKTVFQFFQPAYHYGLALLGAVIYRFPSRGLTVIGVTGTKGKSTTTELMNAILEAAGYKTALQNTLRFKLGDKEERNLFKMSMPGRFFMQKFLRQAADQGCSHAVLELTSEGAKQFRHKFIGLNALIFTNLAPEHIESHGSYENYVEAKLSIAKELENSGRNPGLIVNVDDKEAEKFLSLNIKNKISYSLHNVIVAKSDESGSSFQVGKVVVHSKLPGVFNIYNMLGAIACAKFLQIPEEMIKKGIENMEKVRGRAESVKCGQDFEVVVDYAHTPDSLKAIYQTYAPRPTDSAMGEDSSSQNNEPNTAGGERKLICVLGNTGGGRDKWKRGEMGKIADSYCSEIILTNEDPYDEDPVEIVEDVKKGIQNKPVEIIMDRREAIRVAISKARHGDAVLITGKGTDPYIMGPNGTKEEWDDATVAKEELKKRYA